MILAQLNLRHLPCVQASPHFYFHECGEGLGPRLLHRYCKEDFCMENSVCVLVVLTSFEIGLQLPCTNIMSAHVITYDT